MNTTMKGETKANGFLLAPAQLRQVQIQQRVAHVGTGNDEEGGRSDARQHSLQRQRLLIIIME